MPAVVKTPAAFADGKSPISTAEVHQSVSDLAKRIVAMPTEPRKTPFNARLSREVTERVQEHVHDIMGAPPIVRTPAPPCGHRSGIHDEFCDVINEPDPIQIFPPQVYRGVDLAAPVHPKNGKMLWAGVDCPVCPAKASQRCEKAGVLIEKPHKERKTLSEQG